MGYLQAQSRLEPFYRKYGFVRVGREFHFSDFSYVEMVAELKSAIQWVANCIGKDPLRIDRPEGTPNKPGPLERSLLRLVELSSPILEEEVV